MRTLCFGSSSDGTFILNAIKKTRWEMAGGRGKGRRSRAETKGKKKKLKTMEMGEAAVGKACDARVCQGNTWVLEKTLSGLGSSRNGPDFCLLVLNLSLPVYIC